MPAGIPRDEQEAAGRFLAWLAQPAQQARWHRGTGYFPVRGCCRRPPPGWLVRRQPRLRDGRRQLLDTQDGPATRGARIGPFDTVRTLVEEAYVDVTHGRDVKSAVGALGDRWRHSYASTPTRGEWTNERPAVG